MPSVSIKGVLRGDPRAIPVADEEIDDDDLVTSIGEEEQTEVTEEDIRKAWKAYAVSIERIHPRIFSTLNQQVPRVNTRGVIQITLNTQAQREYFLQTIRPELVRYFQKTLADVEYVFETNLISNETTAKKVYTDQDKLEFMIRKNPELEKLKNRFSLDFDQ